MSFTPVNFEMQGYRRRKEDIMKKVISIIVFALTILVFLSGRMNAQVSVTGNISAEVIEAITAIESSPMSFGRFSTGDQGGEIIIPAQGPATSTSTVVSTGSDINPATFSVSGAKDATFSVTLPQSPTTLTSNTGEGMMLVTDWSASTEKGSDTFVLNDGIQKVRVGATLRVGTMDENPKGIYTGSYQVTFAYN
jgi:hypothetical protein